VRLPTVVLQVLAALPVMVSAWLAADCTVAVEAAPNVNVLELNVLLLMVLEVLIVVTPLIAPAELNTKLGELMKLV